MLIKRVNHKLSFFLGYQLLWPIKFRDKGKRRELESHFETMEQYSLPDPWNGSIEMQCRISKIWLLLKYFKGLQLNSITSKCGGETGSEGKQIGRNLGKQNIQMSFGQITRWMCSSEERMSGLYQFNDMYSNRYAAKVNVQITKSHQWDRLRWSTFC